jgi:DNA-binding transcriptional regulator LsrR (DeoR family)
MVAQEAVAVGHNLGAVRDAAARLTTTPAIFTGALPLWRGLREFHVRFAGDAGKHGGRRSRFERQVMRRPTRILSGATGHDEALAQVRLVVKVAHMYHQRGLNQPQIATQLKISQARVSRLLKLAHEQGIVRTTVHVPSGVFTEIEDALEQRYRVNEVVVVDSGQAADEDMAAALGASAATYLEVALPAAEVIGISSWSETLLTAVEAMQPLQKGSTQFVVQVLGGIGKSASQVYATRLTERLAQLTGARPVFLLGPGIVGTPSARQTLLGDPHFVDVVSYFDRLSLVLTGIGSLTPSRLLRDSGNVIGCEDEEKLQRLGAVGDICLHFFDEDGHAVPSALDARVLGISVEQLKRTPRVLALAGGIRKFKAVRGALRGRWIDTLITDLGTAQRLLEQP